MQNKIKFIINHYTNKKQELLIWSETEKRYIKNKLSKKDLRELGNLLNRVNGKE
jgi:hypothetical protein